MKNIILIISAMISFTSVAQIGVNGTPVSTITNSNVFLDASSSFSTEAGAGPNTGKGIILPSVDLVNFAFDLNLADGFTFPTYFDGMVVYNNATGTTLTSGNRSSLATPVAPGYYYFSNPNGATNSSVTGGEWKPLGGTSLSGTSPIAISSGVVSLNDSGVSTLKIANDAVTTAKIAANAITIAKLPTGASATTFLRGDGTWTNDIKDVTSTEIVVPTKVNGAQLYAITGSFTATGSDAIVTITKPTGMTGYYSIVIYKDGKTFRNSILSFDTAAATNNVVTGYGPFTEAYPAGTYNYMLEYFK